MGLRTTGATNRSHGGCCLALALALAACGDHARSDTADHPSNGAIAVDEAGVVGDVRAGKLELAIPVRAQQAARGTLQVSLRSVNGESVLQRAAVPYALADGAKATLHASLPLPNIEGQAALVDYNVRVEQSGTHVLRVTRSLLYVLPAVSVRLEGPSKLRAAKQASYRAVVEDARTHAPLADRSVELTVRSDDDVVQTIHADSDERGVAMFELGVDEPGDYTVEASTAGASSAITLGQGITVEQPGSKVLLTTDKPLYQPGQRIHLRALVLASPGNQPLAEQAVTFEVEDAKGNKIMKRELMTEAHGIAATTFQLGNVLNMGTFKLRAIAGEVKGEKTIEVSRYVLPKLDVALDADREWYTPGATVHGSVAARYFFGKNVIGGQVLVEASTLDVGANVFARVMGVTDDAGNFEFDVTLPETLAGIPLQDGNALVTLRATVTDSAEQQVTKEKALTVAPAAIRLALVPESSVLVPGIENRFHLFASDPLGAPIVGAEAEVSAAGQTSAQGETDAFGHLELRFTPASGAETETLSASVQPADGPKVSETFELAAQSGDQHVLVRTDKSIYQLGETVQVHVFSSKPKDVAYVDWLNEGQAVDMRTLQLADGSASFTMTADPGLLGDNRIEAYVVDDDGNVVRAGRSLVIKSDGALHVSLGTDKDEYRPGEPAQLTFSVVDEQGHPAVAALGVQIVDEAVFSLIDSRPGLLKTYFEIEDAFAKPQYEIKGPLVGFDQLLFEDTAPGAKPDVANAAQVRAEGALAALALPSLSGIQLSSWPQTIEQAHDLLAKPLKAERKRLIALLTPIAQRELDQLVARGCAANEYYCDAIGMSLADAVVAAAKGQLAAYDFWGNAYRDQPQDYLELARLISSGPDERQGTADDETIRIALSDLQLIDSANGGHAVDAGICFGCGEAPGNNEGGKGGAAGSGGSTAGGNGGSGDEGGPRVRRDFPETLYVNPTLITDADGKATVALDMADSITEWRVSALANASDGKLGGGQAGIRVFQDFFVDVSFPAELTRGDEVEFPVVVYNYLDDAQTVQLTLADGAWFTPLGDVAQSVELAAGQVSVVHFPVRVDEVGDQSLTVQAIGQSASDAVARSVRVVPDGRAVSSPQSGSLAEGQTSLAVSFPEAAVPGSQELYLDVFPAFLAQAVQGLDSLLQVPSGCFEQTTSTTWPNVLVTRYLKETDQTTPEVQLKAESLISAGYQRLLTFEHSGGGFSWFGEQDPAPFLSVTAFGLMEFTDMAAVSAVDPAMIARTQKWLLDQQEGDGSWKGDMSEFFTFHTSSVRNTAFVLWALAQNGYKGAEVDRGLAFVKANLGKDDRDSYTLALVANAFALAAPNDAFGGDLLAELDAAKQVDGDRIHWDAGETQTNFYGAGDDAAVSTTALVAHAMLTAGGYTSTVNGALAYLTAAKDSLGNFGSTQATVWTLKTLLLSALKGTEGAVGSLAITLDGTNIADVELSTAQSDVMTRVEMSGQASTGEHTVGLAFSGSGKVSYNLVSKHNVPWTAGAPSGNEALSITVEYDRTALSVDETVEATTSVRNETAAEQNMILVTVGIPPGFELISEDLDAYVQAQALSHYERTGKQLTLYLQALAAHELRAFSYRLRATMPVRASDGGASARPYYEPAQQVEAAATLLTATE